MKGLGQAIHEQTGWLYTRLHENPLLFIDLWSLVHLWSGFILMSLLRRPCPRRKWPLLVALLAGWELLELAFIYLAFGLFLPETIKDQVTDLAAGVLGAALCEAFARYHRSSPAALPSVTGVLVSLTLSFAWVGSYGYRYNHDFLNSPGLNWWAFLLWSLGCLGVIACHARMRARWRSLRAATLWTLAGYVPALLVAEFVGFAVLRIQEVSHHGPPLVLDLIHGPPVLWAAYATAPLLTIGVYLAAVMHFGRSFRVAEPEGHDNGRGRGQPTSAQRADAGGMVHKPGRRQGMDERRHSAV